MRASASSTSVARRSLNLVVAASLIGTVIISFSYRMAKLKRLDLICYDC